MGVDKRTPMYSPQLFENPTLFRVIYDNDYNIIMVIFPIALTSWYMYYCLFKYVTGSTSYRGRFVSKICNNMCVTSLSQTTPHTTHISLHPALMLLQKALLWVILIIYLLSVRLGNTRLMFWLCQLVTLDSMPLDQYTYRSLLWFTKLLNILHLWRKAAVWKWFQQGRIMGWQCIWMRWCTFITSSKTFLPLTLQGEIYSFLTWCRNL